MGRRIHSYINLKLPAEAKRNGVRLRWWQPRPSPSDSLPGSSHLSADWAIDDVSIGGRESNPDELRDEFREEPRDEPDRELVWLQRSNMRQTGFCGEPDAIVGELQDKVIGFLGTLVNCTFLSIVLSFDPCFFSFTPCFVQDILQ